MSDQIPFDFEKRDGFYEMDPLYVVRQEFERRLTDGLRCPCCDRWSKIYKRTLNNTMIRALQWMASETLFRGDAINVPIRARKNRSGYDFGKQYSTLKWWGLIKPAKGSGNWEVTDKGYDFLTGVGTAPQWVHTNNGGVVNSGPEIHISDVYTDYDHEETMAPIRGSRDGYDPNQ